MRIGSIIVLAILLLTLLRPAQFTNIQRTTYPILTDPSYHFCLGPPRTSRQDRLEALGATSIVFHCGGFEAGVYVDDTTPHQRRVLLRLRDHHPGLIFAGIASGGGHPYHLRGVIDDQEFYPYGSGASVSAFLPLPHVSAYIVQKHFTFPGHSAPTLAQRKRLWQIVRRQHPKYIWTY